MFRQRRCRWIDSKNQGQAKPPQPFGRPDDRLRVPTLSLAGWARFVLPTLLATAAPQGRINAPRAHGPISESRRTGDQLARPPQACVPDLQCHERLEMI